jgi:hypothetical protein
VAFSLGGNKAYLLLLVGGLFAAEALLSMWTGMGYDMKVWFNTGVWMKQGINIYLPENHLGYPPVWAFWCLAANQIYTFFGNNMELWRFTIKLPMILAQFALAFAVGRFVQTRFNPQTARKVFLVTLTWIFFIYIGALWGQLNLISALLVFLAFYATTTKRTLLGGALLGAAVALKIYPLIVLPAFMAYTWKNQGKRETGKLVLTSLAVPVVFTLAVFAVYQWDILYFLKTIFYWTPAFDANPILMQGGCMNIWSFASTLNVDISQVAILRFVWIPVLAACALFWFRKPRMNDADLNLSLTSFYVLFMLTYSWVSEQSFVDPLPFIFLQILVYRPKRSYMYALAGVQALIFAFSFFNWGPFIFEPLLTQFSPGTLTQMQFLDPSKSSLIWSIREEMGLFVSLGLTTFLAIMVKPELLERLGKLRKKKSFALSENGG